MDLYIKQELQHNKLDNILKKILPLDGNETSFIKEKDTYLKFQRLIVLLVEARYDIRYCSNENCPCHPEYTIRKLLTDKGLSGFLKEWKVFDEIETFIGDYLPLVASFLCEDGE